jgi:hypothetical protein
MIPMMSADVIGACMIGIAQIAAWIWAKMTYLFMLGRRSIVLPALLIADVIN